MSRGRLVAWVAVLATLAGLLLVAGVDDGGPPSDEERAQDLFERFACPECAGQPVSESNAPVSVNIRDFITGQIAAGRSDQDIEDALVQAYDTDVLLVPPSSGFGALAWVLPVVGFTVGATGLAWVLTRDRARGSAGPTDDDRALVERARLGR